MVTRELVRQVPEDLLQAREMLKQTQTLLDQQIQLQMKLKTDLQNLLHPGQKTLNQELQEMKEEQKSQLK